MLDLDYRLTQLQGSVHAMRVSEGHARFVARRTRDLSLEEATFVDATVAYLAQALLAMGDTSTLDRRRVKAVLILANPSKAVRIIQAYLAWQ